MKKWTERREQASEFAGEYPMLVVVGLLTLIVLIVVIIVYFAGGFAAEPPYYTWCDSPSVQGGQTVANRIYESHTGDITVVKEDKTC